MAYSLFLDGWKLPVATDALSVRSDRKSEEYAIIGLGRVQQPEARGLRSISFVTEFPGQIYSYVDAAAWEPPRELLRRLEEMQTGAAAVRFVAVGETGKLSLPVTVADLTVEEEGGEDGDLKVTLKLLECPPFGVVLTDVERLPRPGREPVQETVIIRSGEIPLGRKAPLSRAGSRTVQAALEQVAIAQGKNPLQLPENKPIYLGNGQMEFDARLVTSTIDANKISQGIQDMKEWGSRVSILTGSVEKQVGQVLERIPAMGRVHKQG